MPPCDLRHHQYGVSPTMPLVWHLCFNTPGVAGCGDMFQFFYKTYFEHASLPHCCEPRPLSVLGRPLLVKLSPLNKLFQTEFSRGLAVQFWPWVVSRSNQFESQAGLNCSIQSIALHSWLERLFQPSSSLQAEARQKLTHSGIFLLGILPGTPGLGLLGIRVCIFANVCQAYRHADFRIFTVSLPGCITWFPVHWRRDILIISGGIAPPGAAGAYTLLEKALLYFVGFWLPFCNFWEFSVVRPQPFGIFANLASWLQTGGLLSSSTSSHIWFPLRQIRVNLQPEEFLYKDSISG